MLELHLGREVMEGMDKEEWDRLYVFAVYFQILAHFTTVTYRRYNVLTELTVTFHESLAVVPHLCLYCQCRWFQSAPLVCLRYKSILEVKDRSELLSFILVVLRRRISKPLITFSCYCISANQRLFCAAENQCRTSYFDSLLVELGIFGDVVQVRLLSCNIREQVL